MSKSNLSKITVSGEETKRWQKLNELETDV